MTEVDKAYIGLYVNGFDNVQKQFKQIEEQAKGIKKPTPINFAVGNLDLSQAKQKLDEIRGQTIGVNVQANGAEGLKQTLDSLQGKSVPVSVMATGQEQLGGIKQNLDSLQPKTIPVTITASGAENAKALADAIAQVEAGLRTQIATLGMNSAELQRYTLMQQGATSAQLATTQSLQAQLAASQTSTQLATSISQVERELQKEIIALTRGASAAKLYELAQKGASETQLRNVRQLQAQRAAAERSNNLRQTALNEGKSMLTSVGGMIKGGLVGAGIGLALGAGAAIVDMMTAGFRRMEDSALSIGRELAEAGRNVIAMMDRVDDLREGARVEREDINRFFTAEERIRLRGANSTERREMARNMLRPAGDSPVAELISSMGIMPADAPTTREEGVARARRAREALEGAEGMSSWGNLFGMGVGHTTSGLSSFMERRMNLLAESGATPEMMDAARAIIERAGKRGESDLGRDTIREIEDAMVGLSERGFGREEVLSRMASGEEDPFDRDRKDEKNKVEIGGIAEQWRKIQTAQMDDQARVPRDHLAESRRHTELLTRIADGTEARPRPAFTD